MTVTSRADAERDLQSLINRAMAAVPNVRADKIDEVLRLFDDAVKFMEASLEIIVNTDSEDEDEPNPALDNSNSKAVSSKLAVLTAAASSEPKQNAKANFRPSAIPNMLVNQELTRDFSSPSLGKRRLGAASGDAAEQGLAKKGGKGLGMKKSGSKGLGLGLGSSRDPSPKLTANTSGEPSGGPSLKLGGGGGSSAPSGDAKPMKKANPLLARVGGSSITRDFSSPSLGGRRLGAKSAPEAGGGDDLKPRGKKPEAAAAPSFGGTGLGLAGLAGLDSAINGGSGGGGGGGGGEPIFKPKKGLSPSGSPAKKKDRVGALNSLDKEVPASPQQMRASLSLLQMASTGEAEKVSTPKAAFLRRLDSPGTTHSKLTASRTKLNMLLQKAMTHVKNLRMEAFPEVKAQLEKALAELEVGAMS